MMTISYEQRMRLLAQCKPEYKDKLLLRILKGENVDITRDSDLFYQINKDRVSLEEFTNRSKFKPAAEATKSMKQHMLDPRTGRSRGKQLRWLGDIPAEIYFSRPEFSPTLAKGERDRNIKKFLNSFPTFRAGDKQA